MMASYINRGESVFFQFRNEKSVLNSQCKPRMFKTAEKATLGVHYLDTDEIVEYAEVVHAHWEAAGFDGHGDYKECCSNCKTWSIGGDKLYCPCCGAKMDGE